MCGGGGGLIEEGGHSIFAVLCTETPFFPTFFFFFGFPHF